MIRKQSRKSPGRRLGPTLRNQGRSPLARFNPIGRSRTVLNVVPGERVFTSRQPIRFVLEEATEVPDLLVVVFSADHLADQPPPYHYRGALRQLGCHKLFVLDDRGPDGRACWYLGQTRHFDVAASVLDLLRAVTSELGIEGERTVAVGSSKGGWAALYFGITARFGHVIAGEPQTRLGSFLLGGEQAELGRYIAGGDTDTDRRFLDNLLFDAIEESLHLPEVLLLCGRHSNYYQDHVQPLVTELARRGARWELELAPWRDHVPDLGRHFPDYLLARLDSIALSTASQPVP